MADVITEVDVEVAQAFKAVVMGAIAEAIREAGGVADLHAVLNGVVNAACELISKCPDPVRRRRMAGQAVRLLLVDTGTDAAEVLAEVERGKFAALLVDSQPVGRA